MDSSWREVNVDRRMWQPTDLDLGRVQLPGQRRSRRFGSTTSRQTAFCSGRCCISRPLCLRFPLLHTVCIYLYTKCQRIPRIIFASFLRLAPLRQPTHHVGHPPTQFQTPKRLRHITPSRPPKKRQRPSQRWLSHILRSRIHRHWLDRASRLLQEICCCR